MLLLSLCIPTNGVSEWVFPVLDNIFDQGVNNSLYEIVLTNNGDDELFHNKMREYASLHENLVYCKNNSVLFDNQLEALKLAKGQFLKFLNHRSIIENGALQTMIDFINENITDKPVIYFSNGELKKNETVNVYDSFDSFVNNLGIYASWTTGVGIWKEDYDKIPQDMQYDKISPHSGILFSERKKDKYIINDFCFSHEIDTSHANKGKYDLFKAFAVEEYAITLRLYIDGDISVRTLKKVKNDYRKFLSNLYWCFCIRKQPCSYDLKGFDNSMGIFFNKSQIVFGAYIEGIKGILRLTRKL